MKLGPVEYDGQGFGAFASAWEKVRPVGMSETDTANDRRTGAAGRRNTRGRGNGK
jgi:hypothetical protein